METEEFRLLQLQINPEVSLLESSIALFMTWETSKDLLQSFWNIYVIFS